MSHEATRQELDRRLRHIKDIFPNIAHQRGQHAEEWTSTDDVAELLRRVEVLRASGIHTFLESENAKIVFDLARKLPKAKAVLT